MTAKARKKAEPLVNAADHRIYLRTDDDDPHRNATGTRRYAPGDVIEPGGEVHSESLKKLQEQEVVLPQSDYNERRKAAEEADYERTPSDRPPVVDTAAEAVAAGNNSLAPAGGSEDGPPPPGDAPGFGFEGAINLSDLPVSGQGSTVAVTGASDKDKHPKAAQDIASTTPGAENPEDLVSEDAKDKGITPGKGK